MVARTTQATQVEDNGSSLHKQRKSMVASTQATQVEDVVAYTTQATQVEDNGSSYYTSNEQVEDTVSSHNIVQPFLLSYLCKKEGR